MMKYTSMDQVKVGHWVTLCCEEELYQITTEKERANVQEYIKWWLNDPDDPANLRHEYWPDELSALEEIRASYQPGVLCNDDAIAAIDARIAQIAK